MDFKSYSSKDDPDGLAVTFTFPEQGFHLRINEGAFYIKKEDILSKGQISFDEKDGIDGTLIVKNATTNLEPEVYAFREIVLAGMGGVSTLFMGYKNNRFNGNPLKGYGGIVDFVEPIWDLSRPGWRNLQYAGLMVGGDFELGDYWADKMLHYGDVREGYTKPPTESIKKEVLTDCSDHRELLDKLAKIGGGPRVNQLCRSSHVMGYAKLDGLYYLVSDYVNKNRLAGPFSWSELSKAAGGNIVPCKY